MNLYYLILIRVIITGLILWSLLKFSNIRQHDKTIALRFDLISWIRLVFVIVLDASLFLIPAAKMSILYGFIVGNGMIVLTALSLRQIMLFGDKLMYFKESGFMIKDITNFKHEGARVSMRIKNNPLSFKLPITDLVYAQEKLSGKRPRSRKR